MRASARVRWSLARSPRGWRRGCFPPRADFKPRPSRSGWMGSAPRVRGAVRPQSVRHIFYGCTPLLRGVTLPTPPRPTARPPAADRAGRPGWVSSPPPTSGLPNAARPRPAVSLVAALVPRSRRCPLARGQPLPRRWPAVRCSHRGRRRFRRAASGRVRELTRKTHPGGRCGVVQAVGKPLAGLPYRGGLWLPRARPAASCECR